MAMNRRDFLKTLSALGAVPALRISDAVAAVATSDSAHIASAQSAEFAASRNLQKTAELFRTPSADVRPGGYWWWFNTLMDKAGITRDLEQFHAKGIGEVLLVNSAANASTAMPSGAPFFGPEWFDLFKFAISEADRLGIKVGFNLCTGWCMGGPWIKPEDSGRWYLQSEKHITGPTRFSEKLPLPGNKDGYDNVKSPLGIQNYYNLPLDELDYRDTKILAFPVSGDGGARIGGSRAETLTAKANRLDASAWTPAEQIMEKPLEPWTDQPQDEPVPLDRVIDLTDKLQPDGTLTWDVPAGQWVILRTGSRMTGSKIFLGLPGADGLSVDWLASKPVDIQFENMARPLLEAVKPYVGKTLIYFCDDSFEDGFPNWTHDIVEQFRKYRGYDPTPYLGALRGYIIGSAEQTERFLYDYRKTVADLMADRHYGHFAQLCHENGLQVQNESAGPSRSGTMCMDGLKNLGRSDFPMGEFWIGKVYGQPNDEDPSLSYGQTRLEGGQNKVTKMVASAAHTYGKPLVSAESFTTTGRIHWGNYPGMLRYAADRAFCEGVNRIMIHTTTATRPSDGRPGYEYYAGTHFNPNVTWWEQSAPFLKYLQRCQSLLRAGRFVADVLYYHGDWAPNLVEAKHTPSGLGRGYDYDACSEEVLMTRLEVKDGRLMLPDGMSYALLVLPKTNRMPLEVLQKVKDLIAAGATVIGPKPTRDPGLKNYPGCDDEVLKLADEIWGKDAEASPAGAAQYGKGWILWGPTERETLQQRLQTPEDLSVDDAGTLIDYIHRQTDEADIYYVLNRQRVPVKVKCGFRVGPRQPVLADPVSGEWRPLPVFETGEKQTFVPLEFEPRTAYFIIFPRGKSSEAATPKSVAGATNFPRYKTAAAIQGPWDVDFDPKWKGPGRVRFETLVDWTQHKDESIRHYSGTARYSKTITIDNALASDPSLAIHLGEVQVIADVRLNGQKLDTVWTTPWRASIAGVVKPGENLLEIDVTNLWPNRLIADAALPEDQRVTNTNIHFDPKEKPLPSGLIGPVQLVMKDR